MNDIPLKGRTALVTGSGKNIGRAIALDLARQGANLVLNGYRDAAALEAVAAEARALGVQAMPVLADVGDAQAVQDMVQRAVSAFGSVDIAVSNVSVRLHQPLLEISVADWERVLQTNLSAAFFMARACLPHMKERRWGRIIHISGRDGFAPKAHRAHNVTCKAGVYALAKAIAIEFGEYGITANAVAPGIVETTRDPAHYPDASDGFEARRLAMPLQRLGKVEDIAGACSYLCSPAGGYVTGQILHVNGGEFMF
jgi:NAD(P)-dependent dehydrogenase (short-subunit alcohol dehydrogenase family)